METLDWFARAWGALDGWHRLMMLGGVVLFICGVYPALGQRKEGPIVMDKPNVIVNGPVQVGNSNVQHNIIVNAAAAYSSTSEVLQRKEDAVHHTLVRFPITDGPWGASAQSAFEIKLSAPWQRYEITGFPGARMDVRISEHPEQGSLFYSTATPPNARMVEFHFFGARPMQVVQVAVSPRR